MGLIYLKIIHHLYKLKILVFTDDRKPRAKYLSFLDSALHFCDLFFHNLLSFSTSETRNPGVRPHGLRKNRSLLPACAGASPSAAQQGIQSAHRSPHERAGQPGETFPQRRRSDLKATRFHDPLNRFLCFRL